MTHDRRIRGHFQFTRRAFTHRGVRRPGTAVGPDLAQVVAAPLTSLGAITNFAFVSYHPFWSLRSSHLEFGEDAATYRRAHATLCENLQKPVTDDRHHPSSCMTSCRRQNGIDCPTPDRRIWLPMTLLAWPTDHAFSSCPCADPVSARGEPVAANPRGLPPPRAPGPAITPRGAGSSTLAAHPRR